MQILLSFLFYKLKKKNNTQKTKTLADKGDRAVIESGP